MERNFFVEEFVNPFKIYFRLFLLSLIRSLFMMHYKWVRRRFIGVLKLKVMKISKHNCNKPHLFCVMSMLIFSVFLLALFNEQTNKQMKSKSYLRRMCSLICQAAGRYFNRLASMGKSIIVLKISMDWKLGIVFTWIFKCFAYYSSYFQSPHDESIQIDWVRHKILQCN